MDPGAQRLLKDLLNFCGPVIPVDEAFFRGMADALAGKTLKVPEHDLLRESYIDGYSECVWTRKYF